MPAHKNGYVKHNVSTSQNIIHPFTYYDYKEYVSTILKKATYNTEIKSKS